MRIRRTSGSALQLATASASSTRSNARLKAPGLTNSITYTRMAVLAAGPIDLFGRSWQIHTMLGFVALTLIGAQVIQLGVFARTYARVRIGEHDLLLERLGSHLRLEHGLAAGGLLVLLSLAGLAWVGVEWAATGNVTVK